MADKLEIDPYFINEVLAGEHDYKRIGAALIEYLKLYLEPEIIAKIRLVDDTFFFKDEAVSDYGYKPQYKGFEKIDAPDVGTIIIDTSSVLRGLNKVSESFHSVLAYCLLFGYLSEHPEEKIFKQKTSSYVKSKLHKFMDCLKYKLFDNQYMDTPRIIFIPLDLNALYVSTSLEPELVRILKRKDDKIVIHVKQFGERNYSIVVRHQYQEDEFDALPPEVVENMLAANPDIDDVIAKYQSGHLQWLNDKVFASTLAWADDGFVYALREGTDELVDAFISRHPTKVQRIVQGNAVMTGAQESELIRDTEGRPKGDWITMLALRRKNSKLDKLFLWQRQLSGQDLLSMEIANRYDMLAKVDTDKLKKEYKIYDNIYTLFYDLKDLIEDFGKDYQNIDNLEELMKIYWPALKKSVGDSDVLWGEGEEYDHEIQTVRGFVVKDEKLYHILKKIDPDAVTRWLKSIKTPQPGRGGIRLGENNDWLLFESDEMYEELMSVNPITDFQIREYLKRLHAAQVYKEQQKPQHKRWKYFESVKDVLKRTRINKTLKERMKKILKDNPEIEKM